MVMQMFFLFNFGYFLIRMFLRISIRLQIFFHHNMLHLRKLKIVNLQCVLLCTVFEKLKSYLLQKLLNIFKNAFDTVVSLRF